MSLEMPSYQRHWRIYLVLVALAIVVLLIRSWQSSPEDNAVTPVGIDSTLVAPDTSGMP